MKMIMLLQSVCACSCTQFLLPSQKERSRLRSSLVPQTAGVLNTVMSTTVCQFDFLSARTARKTHGRYALCCLAFVEAIDPRLRLAVDWLGGA